MNCPACGRFVGAVEECPYCGVEPPGAWRLRALKAGSLFLALAGTAMLLVSAQVGQTPLVRAGELGPGHQLGRVALEGTVTRAPVVKRRNGRVDYVDLRLRDGREHVLVVAHGAVASELAGSGRLPARGAAVRVRGSVLISAGGEPCLILDSADGVLGVGE